MHSKDEMNHHPMVHLFQGSAWGVTDGHGIENLQISDLSVEMLTTLLKDAGEDAGVTYHYDNKDELALFVQNGHYPSLGVVKHLTLSFGEYNEAFLDNEEAWLAVSSQYFWTGYKSEAIQAFLGRLTSGEAGMYYQSNHSESLENIAVRNNKRLRFCNHYGYLDAILDQFWRLKFRVNPSEMGCAGIVSAHGDKCYSYKDEWKAAGIPFEHGSLLYLLTYTEALGSYPKSKSQQWVLHNYAKLLPTILAAEMAVLCFQYKLDVKQEVEWDLVTPEPREDGLNVWSYSEYGVVKGEITCKTKTEAVELYLHKYPKKFVQHQGE